MVMRRLVVTGLLGVMTLGLAACDTWMGAEEAPPLPGKRLAVLTGSRSVEPDAALADKTILLPPPSVNKAWPQSGGYANHAMHHTAVNEPMHEVWSSDIGAGTSDALRQVSSPVVADGKVFTIDTKTRISAFDDASGDRLWRRDLNLSLEDDGHIPGGIAFDAGRLYVATGFGRVVAIDANTGKVVWDNYVQAPMRAAPTVRHGRVFVVTLDNRAIALNATTGETLWEHQGLSEEAGLLGSASPAVDGGVVVVPFSSGELAALRVENGHPLWSDVLSPVRRTDAVSTLAHIRGNPVIDRGIVIATSHGGLTVAIDLRTGQRIWERDIGGPDNPWVAGDYIFSMTNQQEVIALSRETGGVFWVRALPQFEDEEDRKDPIVWTGPVLASDRLIVGGSTGEALALSPYSGKIIGKVEMPDGVTVPPVVAGGGLYFLTTDADLVAYR